MQITNKLLKQFLENYDIGNLVYYQKIELGLMNKIVILKTDKGKFILKIVVQNNFGNRLDYELDLLNYLSDLPTPKPIKRKDSRYWSHLGNNKAFIMSFVQGEHRKMINDTDLKNIGRFLANMHKQSVNFRSPVKRLETLSHTKIALRGVYKKCKKIKDLRITRAFTYIKDSIDKYLPCKDMVIGAIHSDLKPENCLFKNQKLSGVVDFDNSYTAPLIIDLANTIIWFCSKGDVLDIKKAQILARAYQKVRKLSQVEKSYLFHEAIHFVYLRNSLRAIEYYAMRKVKKDLVYWAINNFLSTEQKMPARIILLT